MPRIKVMAAVLEVCKILFFTKQGHTAQVQDHSWSYKGYHMLSTVYMHFHFPILKYNLTISEKKMLVDFISVTYRTQVLQFIWITGNPIKFCKYGLFNILI